MADADVIVIGAGPAGWAAAAACARAGLQVHVVAPCPTGPWRQTYGAWLDELVAADAEAVVGRRWDTVLVRTVGSGFRNLARTYCLISNDRLQRTLQADAVSATVTATRARHLDVRADHLVVETSDGPPLRARAVIDASGYPAVFGSAVRAGVAHQTAYGVVGRFVDPPIPAGSMFLMDFDAQPFSDAEPPTFLYAMDLGDGRWFVEETSLAGRPAVPLALLRQRLERRLTARGADATEVIATERCAFAMNAPLPRPGPAVAFGAAAAMVHPATGYHVANALQRAPVLGAALCKALDQHRDPRMVAHAGHRAVWPADAIRRDALYRLGLEVVLALDTASIQAFFDGFFALPADDWRGYVSRTSSPLGVQRTMTRLMRQLPPAVRSRVLAAVATRGALRALAGLVAPAFVSR